MDLLNNEKRHIPLLLLLAAVLFFLNIHVIPLTDGDSAFYAKIAKNIVSTGDWMTMHYGNNTSVINKPPLFMWITAAAYKVFGMNDFAVNFWHSLIALLCVIFTYKLAKELFNSKVAFISSLILVTSAQFFYQARSPLQDMPIALFTVLSVYAYVRYEKKGSPWLIYLSSVFMALGTLTKGPVGLALPALIIFLYIILGKKKFPPLIHIIGAVVLFFAAVMPWFVIEYRILGKRFLDVFIGDNFGRYLMPIDTIGNEATKYQKIQPQYDFYSYFAQLLLLYVPWSGFLYPSIYYAFKKKNNGLALIFALTVIIFFSLSLNYKISRYILPAFPALAIITGKMIYDALEIKDKEAIKMFSLSCWLTLIFIAIPIFLIGLYYTFGPFSELSAFILPIFLPFILMLTIGLIIGSVAALMKKFKLAFASFVSLSSVAYILLIFGLSSYFSGLNPIGKYTEYINEHARTGDIVCQYKGTDAHFMIYYSKHDVQFIRDENVMKKLLNSGKKLYCISQDTSAYRDLKKYAGRKITEVAATANYALFTNIK